MSNKKPFILILIILFFCILSYVVFNKYGQEIKISNQSIELKNKAKEDKITRQLETASSIIETDNEKAFELAKLSLYESEILENKFLKMCSFYTLGNCIVDIDKIKISQAYLENALQLAEKLDDNWYRGQILYRLAKNQYRLNDTKLSLETFNEALYFCQLSNNYKTIGATYSMIGTIFRVNGAYSRAIEYFIKSRLNYSKSDFKEGDAWGTYLLGQIHADLRNTNKSMQYFKESLQKYKVLNLEDGNTNGIAICYEQIALLNIELKNFDEAVKYANMLLDIRIDSKSTYGVSNAYSLLGKIDYFKGNYANSITLLNKSLELENGYLSLHSKPGAYTYLGLSTIKAGNFDKGIQKINEGLDIALANNFKKNQLEIYAILAETYLNINNLEKSISYKNKQIELQDLILFGEADAQLEQLQAFYEIDEKNRLIVELKKENVVNLLKIKQQWTYQVLMIFIILIVIIIAIIIYVFYNKLRFKNKELKVLNTTTNKLFSIIAHDLRSPFNTILGFSDLLKTNATGLEITKIVKFSEIINSAASNTLTLLDNLLNWAKSQTGQISFEPTILNFEQTIAQIIVVLKPTAELKNIKLNYIQRNSIEVYADPQMLKTILLNLITNGIKFTNPEGCIEVNAQKNREGITISVADNGIGINTETTDTLFTLQTYGTTPGTANEKGSGLGLVLCKELVEKHGGTIWVTSELNKGTTFYFTLPHFAES